jgi:hypothetical protein
MNKSIVKISSVMKPTEEDEYKPEKNEYKPF